MRLFTYISLLWLVLPILASPLPALEYVTGEKAVESEEPLEFAAPGVASVPGTEKNEKGPNEVTNSGTDAAAVVASDPGTGGKKNGTPSPPYITISRKGRPSTPREEITPARIGEVLKVDPSRIHIQGESWMVPFESEKDTMKAKDYLQTKEPFGKYFGYRATFEKTLIVDTGHTTTPTPT